MVDCKDDKIVFPSDKEQEYKNRLKEKIGEEEFERLMDSDRIIQCPENLENIALVNIETYPDISLIAATFLNDVQREYYIIHIDIDNNIKSILHYSQIYCIGDTGGMPAEVLKREYKFGTIPPESLLKVTELWPDPYYYDWIRENKEHNNPDIDPQVMENIVSLCGEVSMDLPVNGDTKGVLAEVLKCEYNVSTIEQKPLPKIMELCPDPDYYYYRIQKNEKYNNPDIDFQVTKNIISLCGEVSMDLPVNEELQ